MKQPKKSALAKRAEKLFEYDDSQPLEAPGAFPDDEAPGVTMVQFTTYSVCEAPIPDLRKIRS